ncbi:lipid II flippase MurJ, partial [Oenococcus oeni]|uniref:lipid II flippase MurJ n=1 Tax=Oenococcus oeni TaxID=1247 RepID=UPI0028C4FEF7
MLCSNISLFPYLRKQIFAPRWKSLKLFRLIKPALWLFIPTVATNIYLQLNKTMLGLFSGIKQAGYFQQSDYLIKMIISIVTALGTVMMPRIANLYSQQKNKEINSLLRKSFSFVSFISLPASFGVMALGPAFAPLFFGKSFEEVGDVMFVEAGIIFFIGWSNIIGIQFLLPTNRMKSFTFSVTAGALVNLLLNFLFIPRFGASGAAFTTLIAEFSVTIIQFLSVRKNLRIFPMISETWKYLVASIIMFFSIQSLNIFIISGWPN